MSFAYETAFEHGAATDAMQALIVYGLPALETEDVLGNVVRRDRRPRNRIGRVRTLADGTPLVDRGPESLVPAGSEGVRFRYQSEAVEALYRAAYPTRTVLRIEECEHDGDLRRAAAHLIDAGVAIIAMSLLDDDEAYETGVIEVEDACPVEVLLLIAQGRMATA